MMFQHVIILLMLLAPCYGCAPMDNRSQAPAPSFALVTWEIDLGISGGIAGIRLHLKVTSSGLLLAQDMKQGKRVERKARPEQIREITGMLSRLGPGKDGNSLRGLPGRCRDCFQYDLAISVDGRHQRMAMHSTAVRDSRQAELIGVLSALLREALAGTD